MMNFFRRLFGKENLYRIPAMTADETALVMLALDAFANDHWKDMNRYKEKFPTLSDNAKDLWKVSAELRQKIYNHIHL